MHEEESIFLRFYLIKLSMIMLTSWRSIGKNILPNLFFNNNDQEFF